MIGPGLRISLFLRSFLIQGSWNYRTLIGTGIAWALLPVSVARGDREVDRESLGIDEPFNSHPYLSPLALGALARIAQEETDRDRVRRFRNALSSPLGSLGDRLIWGVWRPLCVLVAMFCAALGASPGIVIGLTLAMYNLLHIAIRAWALAAGLSSGFEVGTALEDARFPQKSERVEAVGVLVFGGLLGLLLERVLVLPGPGIFLVGTPAALFLLGVWRRGPFRRWAPALLLCIILIGLILGPDPTSPGAG